MKAATPALPAARHSSTLSSSQGTSLLAPRGGSKIFFRTARPAPKPPKALAFFIFILLWMCLLRGGACWTRPTEHSGRQALEDNEHQHSQDSGHIDQSHEVLR